MEKKKKNKILKRFIKRLVILSVVVISLTGAAGLLIGYFYGNKVKEMVVGEINSRLAIEVSVNEIEFSVFDNFPQASVTVTNIQTKEKTTKNTDPLLKAKRLSVLFNITDIISGKYKIEKILLKDAFLSIVVFKNGTNNFTIFKSSDPKNENGAKIDLNEVILKNVHIAFLDYGTDQEYLLSVNKGILSGGFSSSAYDLKISADIATEYLRTGKATFLKDKKIVINVLFDNDNKNHLLKISKGDLKVNTLSFIVEGSVKTAKNDKSVSLEVKAEKAKLQDFLKEVPAEYLKPVEDLEGRGIFNFTAIINGNFSKKKIPAVKFVFGLTSGNIKYMPAGLTLNDVSFKGVFTNGKLGNKKSFSLQLSEFTSSLNSGSLNGNLKIVNFERPDISVTFSANGKLNEMKKLFHIDTLENLSGNINIDMKFRNRLKSFTKFTINDFLSSKTSGKLTITDAQFAVKGNMLKYKDFNGNFKFSNNNLIVDNFSGKVSGSDFQMKGTFINILPYFFLPDKKFSINAVLNSSMLNFDELLQYKTAESDTVYRIEIAENINISLDLNVKRMKFRKFRARDISGHLIVKNKIISVNNGSFSSMDGHTDIKGKIDGTNPSKPVLTSDADIQNVDISKLFYEFGNFGQDNITSSKLKGTVTAKVTYRSEFDNRLKINPASVYAAGDIKIENGELINYKPLFKLGRYLKNKNLGHIKFSTLKNQIAIRNRVIYIPEMEIKSNTLNLSLNGTHTFDNEIDYHIRVLLSELLSQKKQDELKSNIEGLIIEDDNLGRTTIPIKMTGNASDPKISYDTKTVRKIISDKMKTEKDNIKEVFKKEFGSKNNIKDDDIPVFEAPEEGKEQFIIEWDETKTDSVRKKPKTEEKKASPEKSKNDKANFIIEWDEEDTINSEPNNC